LLGLPKPVADSHAKDAPRQIPSNFRTSPDGAKVDSLLYAGNNLDKARDIFSKAIKHRPRIRLTIRQRTRVLDQWPRK
jgi:hypothetical protein